MTLFFLKVVDISLLASVLIVIIIALKFIPAKSPKWVHCLFWGVVGIRLLCPISIQSDYSPMPAASEYSGNIGFITNTYISGNSADTENSEIKDIAYYDAGEVSVGQQAEESFSVNASTPGILEVLTCIWIAGIVVMLVYMLINSYRIRKRVATAVKYCQNIKQSEFISSPFVIGFFRPTIYLPYNLSEADMANVIAHEQAHIARRDYLWKLLGFLILSFYWFNPAIWLAYLMFCRDIEAACDERVIRNMDREAVKAYSTALLNCSIGGMSRASLPLAFGEVALKSRIKNIMNYRKPAIWITAVSLVLAVCLTFLFLTSGRFEEEKLPVNDGAGEIIARPMTTLAGGTVEAMPKGIAFKLMVNGKVYTTSGVAAAVKEMNGHRVMSASSLGVMPVGYRKYGNIQGVTESEPVAELQMLAGDKVSGDVYTNPDFPDVIYALLVIPWYNNKTFCYRFISYEMYGNECFSFAGDKYVITNTWYKSLDTDAVYIGDLNFIGQDVVPRADLESNNFNWAAYTHNGITHYKEAYLDSNDSSIIYIKYDDDKDPCILDGYEKWVKCKRVE